MLLLFITQVNVLYPIVLIFPFQFLSGCGHLQWRLIVYSRLGSCACVVDWWPFKSEPPALRFCFSAHLRERARGHQQHGSRQPCLAVEQGRLQLLGVLIRICGVMGGLGKKQAILFWGPPPHRPGVLFCFGGGFTFPYSPWEQEQFLYRVKFLA